ncbi:hypothetical protein SAMN05216349_11933 [Oribacterium sp. KHPX15]|uniref:hypothetical protein n=1 Tax=unclassified Oribacterium TaxID=2629782 RepID=UPI0004E1C0D3|nr:MULTISPECIES: hypothetical protein [unclassified Oribacterium]SEA61979.1 hypothetical protein SAMN05216349_11933 [Oribacterium sp. KHPX15]
MEYLFMNLILFFAIASIGYYILDAVLSLFVPESDPVERVRRKRLASKSFTMVKGSKKNRRVQKSMKRAANY